MPNKISNARLSEMRTICATATDPTIYELADELVTALEEERIENKKLQENLEFEVALKKALLPYQKRALVAEKALQYSCAVIDHLEFMHSYTMGNKTPEEWDKHRIESAQKRAVLLSQLELMEKIKDK